MAAIELDMPRLTVSIRVRLPRGYHLRIWLMLTIIRLAGVVGPHDVELEVATRAD